MKKCKPATFFFLGSRNWFERENLEKRGKQVDTQNLSTLETELQKKELVYYSKEKIY